MKEEREKRVKQKGGSRGGHNLIKNKGGWAKERARERREGENKNRGVGLKD